MIDQHIKDVMLARKSFKFRHRMVPTVFSDQELAAISIPTLFLVGENEKIYSPQEALNRLRQKAPQIRTMLIPGAGQVLTIVQKEMVNRLILNFLKGIEIKCPGVSPAATGKHR